MTAPTGSVSTSSASHESVPAHISADVIVVGGGPGGAATAYYLARAGVDVAVLEKATFPRDKICGDGLTPSALAEVFLMGIDTSGYVRNQGLHVLGGGNDLYFDWPSGKTQPSFGSARTRKQFDHDLINRATAAGARLYEGLNVYGAIQSETGRVVGVRARAGRGAQAREITATGKLVVDAGGVAARLATSLGIQRRADRPMGVAARTYFRSPRADETWMESHLELWSGKPGESELLPGYGWIFPVGGGLVNVGLGSVASDATSAQLPYRKVFAEWTKHLPAEWGFTPENQVGPLRSAALPMSFNRKPHYTNGLALVGDAGGMVSPFNGEGIAPAMKSGRLLANAAIGALQRPTESAFDRAMTVYPEELAHEYGGYYQLGRVFVALIENPKIMRLCTYYGLPRRRLMKLVNKLLSDGFERSGGDLDDRLIVALSKLVVKA